MSSSNYSFISEPDPNLKCSICLDLASLPKQCEDCGKLFCSECIEKSGRNPCPNCRASNPRYFRDVKSGRDIKAIRVRCANIRSCPWTGTVGTLYTHLATCEFALVPCPNKCGDDKDAGEIPIMRKDLENHLQTKCLKRPFKCQHCGEKGTYASITGDHDNVCNKKMVACPNHGCRLSVEQGMIKQHMSVCLYMEMTCGLVGCGTRTLRKDIRKHEAEDHVRHLQLLSEQVKILSELVRSREKQHQTLSEGEALVFKVPGYASKKEMGEIFYSTQFYTHPGGYKICIRVDPNGNNDGSGTHVSVFTEVLKGRYDDQLKWPFLGTITYELLNQLADDRHYIIVSTFTATKDMLVGSSKGYHKFLPHSSLCHDPATNTQYLLDDALYFRVSVKVDNHKPWLVCTDKSMSIASVMDSKTILKNGESFAFKITRYNTQRADNMIFYSNSFYTSPGGYNMCIWIQPNGARRSNGTHVSVYSKLLQGSYDASLPWPFLGTVTFTLLNQLSDQNHHQKVLKFENIDNIIVGRSLGYDKFISHSALSHDPVKNIQYLKNDTLYFRVSVKENTRKSWLTCTYN